MLAVVAVNSTMRGSGVGIPSSRGTQVSLYPLMGLAVTLQEKARKVFDIVTTSNPST